MPSVLDVLSGLLTPLIAVLTTYIAYQQYRIRRDERSLQLYDRRLAIFNKVISIVDRTFACDRFNHQEAQEWATSTREADFLFGEEVEEAISYLYEKVLNYADDCETSPEFTQKSADLVNEVELCRSLITDVFTPYLRPAGSTAKRKMRLSKKQVLKRVGRSESTPIDDDIPF